MKNLQIRWVPGKGRGVFGTKAFRQGALIESSPFILVPRREYRVLELSTIDRYWYWTKRGTAVGLGYTSLYNHSEKPNAEFTVLDKEQEITIAALRYIRAGEEITIDYGYRPRGYRE